MIFSHIRAFLSPDKVTDDLVISRQTATELIRPDVRDLELVDEPEQGEISPRGSPCEHHGFFFWLVAAWVKSRAERPSVSGVNRQLHVQIGCKLGIRNRKDELTKQAKFFFFAA